MTENKPYTLTTLPNGLRVVLMPTTSPVSYCGFAIQAGSRDETKGEEGIAHFTEHLLFKGTERRKSFHIVSSMDSVGGEINAYTTKEETFVYSVFLHEHFKRAIDLLFDLVFHSTFPPREMEKERDVILDEINSYKDSPSELIFDEFDEILFPGHPLGHPILGTEETVGAIMPENLKSFTDRLYNPSSMVFYFVGNTSEKVLLKEIEKWNNTPGRTLIQRENRALTAYRPRYEKIEKETHQCHTLIGNRAYGIYEKQKRSALHLLNNIIGGPAMNSRLNLALRERRGLVYNVESSFSSFSDTGIFAIYYGCDQSNDRRCMEYVKKELKKCRDNRLTSLQLNAARKQILGQMGISGENKESLSLALGKSILKFDRYDSMNEIKTKIERVTASELLEVANEILNEEQLSTLCYK